LDSFIVTSQKDIAKEQKDSILKVNEAELQQELSRADTEMVQIEHSLQQLTVGRSTESDKNRSRAGKSSFKSLSDSKLPILLSAKYARKHSLQQYTNVLGRRLRVSRRQMIAQL
jgi:hypothetical protein